jgi:flagellar biosynthesis protein FlhB
MSRGLDSTDLEPLKILGDTFSQTFGPLYLPLIVLSTPTLIIAILQSVIQGTPKPGELPPLPVLALSSLSLFLVTPLIAGTAMIFVHRYLEQSTLDLKDAFSRCLQVLPQLILGMILYILILIPAFLLLIIPGIFLSIQFGFVLYAIAIEECSALGGFKRSWEIVKGRWWMVFLASMLVLLVIGLPTLIIGAIVGGIVGLTSGSIFISTVIGNLFGLLVTPLFNVYYIKLYDRLCETTA